MTSVPITTSQRQADTYSKNSDPADGNHRQGQHKPSETYDDLFLCSGLADFGEIVPIRPIDWVALPFAVGRLFERRIGTLELVQHRLR